MLRFLIVTWGVFWSVSSLAVDTWTCAETGKQFATGARRSSESALKNAALFVGAPSPPRHVAYVPRVRSMFGNDRYGVCVVSEEAFAKSCWIAGAQPELDVPESVVIDWARRRGVLNGADLSEVVDMMGKQGFEVGSQLLNDGSKLLVDFRDPTSLRAAVANGPVKVAIAASALPAGAGSRDGWWAKGGSSDGTDHCVSVCGYGDAGWLYSELGVPLPPDLKADVEGFLVYTWSTIGFVDHAWILGTVDEAWLRRPTTVGVPPIVPEVPVVPVVGVLGLLRRVLVSVLVFGLGVCCGGVMVFWWRVRLLAAGRIDPQLPLPLRL